MTINRIVALLTALLGLGGAVAPVLANMDWQSTAGVMTGVGLACAAALTWLKGWQAHEANQAFAAAGDPSSEPVEDEFDPDPDPPTAPDPAAARPALDKTS